jgi:PDZ domain-containing protein
MAGPPRLREGAGLDYTQMRKPNPPATLLLAASLLIATTRPGRIFAAENAEVLSVPASQAVDTNRLQPSPGAATAPEQMEQNANLIEPPGLQEYLDASEEISLFGMDLRIEQRKAEKEIQGLLIVDLAPGSPGMAAGLHPYRQPTRDFLNGVGMLATMAFPPAVVVVPIVESVPLNEAYDLIIGVDGARVTNFMDFYYCMRDVRPGEVVYLNLLRNGKRVQVPLRITSALPPPQSWVR